MEQGVVIKPYHAWEAGDYEYIAFPESNKYRTHPNDISLPLDDKERMWRINHMGVEYMTYERFKDVENRDELTDEEETITDRFYESIGKKRSR